jgi:hypothetical protein
VAETNGAVKLAKLDIDTPGELQYYKCWQSVTVACLATLVAVYTTLGEICLPRGTDRASHFGPALQRWRLWCSRCRSPVFPPCSCFLEAACWT